MNTKPTTKKPTTKKPPPNTKRPTKRNLRARANRRDQRGGHPGRRAWRSAPATADQLEALRTIAEITGHTFNPETITRGTAWRRIKLATSSIGPGLRLRCAPPWWTPPGTKPTALEIVRRGNGITAAAVAAEIGIDAEKARHQLDRLARRGIVAREQGAPPLYRVRDLNRDKVAA